MSCIYSPTPNSEPGCKFLILYFLKYQPLLTPMSDFVFKCAYVKLEAYGKVWGNVRSLRRSCVKWYGSLKYYFGGHDPGQREKPMMSTFPWVPVSWIVSLNGIAQGRFFSCKQIHRMDFEEIVSLGAQQDRVVWNAAFSVFVLFSWKMSRGTST